MAEWIVVEEDSEAKRVADLMAEYELMVSVPGYIPSWRREVPSRRSGLPYTQRELGTYRRL